MLALPMIRVDHLVDIASACVCRVCVQMCQCGVCQKGCCSALGFKRPILACELDPVSGPFPATRQLCDYSLNNATAKLPSVALSPYYVQHF